MQSGRKRSSEYAEAYRAFVSRWGAAVGPFAASWDAAKGLLYPDRAEGVLKDSVKRTNLRLALLIFGLAALITLLLAMLAMLESLGLAQYTADTMAEVTGIPAQAEDSTVLNAVAFHQAAMYIPITLILLAAHELLVFGMARATGGTGRLDQQLYLSSLVSLSVAFVSVAYLVLPLPCLNVAAGVALIIWSAYLVLYVNTKAYALVHDLSFTHAFVINVIPLVLRLTAIYFISSALATELGIPISVQGA